MKNKKTLKIIASLMVITSLTACGKHESTEILENKMFQSKIDLTENETKDKDLSIESLENEIDLVEEETAKKEYDYEDLSHMIIDEKLKNLYTKSENFRYEPNMIVYKDYYRYYKPLNKYEGLKEVQYWINKNIAIMNGDSFSPYDNKNNSIFGKCDPVFLDMQFAEVGDTFDITDSEGKPYTYKIVKQYEVDNMNKDYYGSDFGINYYENNDKEQLTIQTGHHWDSKSVIFICELYE